MNQPTTPIAMTMQTENNASVLAQSFEQQNKQLLCMLNALHEEHRALSSSDIEAFERAIRNKQDQVIILEKMQSQLNVFEPLLNGKFSKLTVEKYIGSLPTGHQRHQLEKLWETLLKTTNECSKQNIINNRIMDASSAHLRQAISILRGDLTAPTVNIYGASGKQSNGPQGHSLATA